jgi:UDP-N-acetylglucosamine 1-carboxyvinyltransferase
VIGDRPVDLHIRGLKALGAEVEIEGGNMILSAPNGLTGDVIDMRGSQGPTVLGTDNVMMAACLARGTTVIESAASEPEVIDLADFLNSLGARITGAGTRRITIEGVDQLGGTEHTVIPDRIEAGSFMAAAALAGDGVRVCRVEREHLTATTDALERAGHRIEFDADGKCCTVRRGEPACGCDVSTAPYPGFATDMQAQITALLATSKGISVVKDIIFPQRFMHVAELKRMGAEIKVDNGTAVVRGVDGLSAAPVMASDLRASAALVIAALTARGSTEINRLYHIDRGYEHIDEKLLTLGAAVERVRA